MTRVTPTPKRKNYVRLCNEGLSYLYTTYVILKLDSHESNTVNNRSAGSNAPLVGAERFGAQQIASDIVLEHLERGLVDLVVSPARLPNDHRPVHSQLVHAEGWTGRW